MSQIVDFYEGLGTDKKGRTLADMQKYTDHQMEAGHDFIQWMFPLHEKSYHAVDSPVLTNEDIAELQKSDIARKNMLISLNRFLDFLGITQPRDEKKLAWWCRDGNHNLLRITRVIRSLRLFRLDDYAKAFYATVVEIGKGSRGLGNTSFHFWRKAAEDNVTDSLTDDFLKMKRIKL